jgi:hypothetical protein
MKTDDLINALSADGRTSAMPLDRAWMLAIVVAIVAAAATFFSMLGPRPDMPVAMETMRFPFKFVVTITLGASAWVAIRAASRPAGTIGATIAVMMLAPALLIGAMALELLSVPSVDWSSRLMGTNNMLCLTFIPAIGFAPLVLFLMVLRHGAPNRPGLAGAVAGVLAGGVAATFYAAHCTDDSPLFVATWYTLAIALLAALGAIGGRLLARW